MSSGKLIAFVFVAYCGSFPFAAYADQAFAERVLSAAIAQTKSSVKYDGTYTRIAYPGGDVPENIGVCSDVIVRAYRSVGIDLQQLVHEDMVRRFSEYPKLWGLSRPDSNIDHRRVPNLQVFFKRFGRPLPVTTNPTEYQAGDIVTWNLVKKGSLPHIGLVTEKKSDDGLRPLIVHNIGRGPEVEDSLFEFSITGHYRYPVDQE